MWSAFFMSNLLLYYIVMYRNVWYNEVLEEGIMRVITSKSKNAESFYISKGYINDKGVSTSTIVRKLGTLKELLVES